MKAHVGTDLQGIVHSLTTTAAHVADITQLSELLHGEERVLHRLACISHFDSASRAGHPAWRRCSSLTNPRFARSSRLASRAPRPRSTTGMTDTGH